MTARHPPKNPAERRPSRGPRRVACQRCRGASAAPGAGAAPRRTYRLGVQLVVRLSQDFVYTRRIRERNEAEASARDKERGDGERGGGE